MTRPTRTSGSRAALSARTRLARAVTQAGGRFVAIADDLGWGASGSFDPQSRAGRAARHQVSWELHRAGETLHQVSESIATAHSAESRITYTHRDFPDSAPALSRPVDRGISL